MKVPTLIIAESKDSVNMPELCAGPIFEHLTGVPKALAVLDGSDDELDENITQLSFTLWMLLASPFEGRSRGS